MQTLHAIGLSIVWNELNNGKRVEPCRCHAIMYEANWWIGIQIMSAARTQLFALLDRCVAASFLLLAYSIKRFVVRSRGRLLHFTFSYLAKKKKKENKKWSTQKSRSHSRMSFRSFHCNFNSICESKESEASCRTLNSLSQWRQFEWPIEKPCLEAYFSSHHFKSSGHKSNLPLFYLEQAWTIRKTNSV